LHKKTEPEVLAHFNWFAFPYVPYYNLLHWLKDYY